MAEIKKYGYIDSLRGIAVLLVILVHAAQHFETLSPAIFFLTNKGQYGVQLFFIASSLTLFLSFEQRRSIDKANTVKFFLIRRFFRIAPAYYLAIIFYSFLLLVLPLSTFPNPLRVVDVLLSIIFLNGFFPGSINYVPPGGWSVAIEMIFYLLIPFFFAKIKSLQAAVFCFFITLLLCFAFNYAGAYVMTHYTQLDYTYHRTWYFYFWLPNQLPVFVLGMVLFHLLKRKIEIPKLRATIMVLMSCILMVSAFYLIKFYQLENYVPEHIIVGILFTTIVLAMSGSRLNLLENKLTQQLGKLSFSMYLWHFIILQGLAFVIRRIVPASPVVQVITLYVIAVPVIAFISSISYNRIELAGIKAGKMIIDRLQQKSSVSSSAVDVVH